MVESERRTRILSECMVAAFAESEENPIRVIAMAKRVLIEPNALDDGSANPIYLRDQIVSRPGRATGRPGRSGRHIVSLEFWNSRCDGSWGGQIGSGPGGSVSESVEDSVWIILVAKRELAESYALSNGSADAIYLRE